MYVYLSDSICKNDSFIVVMNCIITTFHFHLSPIIINYYRVIEILTNFRCFASLAFVKSSIVFQYFSSLGSFDF